MMFQSEKSQVFGMIGSAAAVLFLIFIWVFCTTKVPAGHVGVVATFGSVGDEVLDEGLHLIKPWKWVIDQSLQTKERKESGEVPTKEGLSVKMDASILYRLSKGKAAEIYRSVGKDYEKVLVESQFRSAMRSATVQFEAKDLYTANREHIEGELLRVISEMLTPRGIIVEAVLLRDITLPGLVSGRIEAKLAADQDAQRMQFVLLKESQEAERRRIEAKGIADAQQIIKKDLDGPYLTYLWIAALKECAQHNNATIYVPTGHDGMPMFKQVK